MLHPNQFTVNETWIAFRLNDAPIQTDADGAFNCLGLMEIFATPNTAVSR